MAIQFEIMNIPLPVSKQNVTAEEIDKIAKRVKKINDNLSKK